MAALVAAGDLSNSIRLLNPESSAEWAAVYASEMRELRRMLQVNRGLRCGLPDVRAPHAEVCIPLPHTHLVYCAAPALGLQENQVELPADRFDASNAELLRFAKACGLLNVSAVDGAGAASLLLAAVIAPQRASAG